MMQCILSDRLYVPEEYVHPEHLNDFVYQIEAMQGYDFGPFEAVTGSIRTFNKCIINGHMHYAFSRGNLEKLNQLFGDVPWVNRTCAPLMEYDLKFKGKLHTWEENQIGQQEAVDVWLKSKGGVIKAPPRFGKCTIGSTIIHSPDFGSIKIEDIFDAEHQNDSFRSRCMNLATKDGIKTTSCCYKQQVDITIKIKTERGYSIQATVNHPLYSYCHQTGMFEWKKMEDIKVDDEIALYSNTNVFTERSSSFIPTYVKYLNTKNKNKIKILRRVMKLNKKSQLNFISLLMSSNDFESDDKEFLELLQVMLLNCGYVSRIVS